MYIKRNVVNCKFLFYNTSLFEFQPELGTILYPLFIHMFLDLIYQGHEEKGMEYIAFI